MIKSEDIIASIVYLDVLLVLIITYHRFRRTLVNWSHAMLSVAAIALGLLQSRAGLIHTITVIAVAIKYDKPYDFHRVFLITTQIDSYKSLIIKKL